MKISLPALTKKRLRWLLDQAYSNVKDELDAQGNVINPTDAKLLRVVRSMQFCNISNCQKEISDLYSLFGIRFFLEPNSEGTTLWLAMVLAVKDLCSLNDEEIQNKIFSIY